MDLEKFKSAKIFTEKSKSLERGYEVLVEKYKEGRIKRILICP